MSTQQSPTLQAQEQPNHVGILTTVNDIDRYLKSKYPVPEFYGDTRKAITGDMVVQLVAHTKRGRLVSRTYEARELIKDDVSMYLPELRTLPFFTEVRKLLISSGSMNIYENDWDDGYLGTREFNTRDGEIMALIPGANLWKSHQLLEAKKIVDFFDRATNRKLERLVFHVEWCSPSVQRELSSAREQIRREGFASTISHKILKKKKKTT